MVKREERQRKAERRVAARPGVPHSPAQTRVQESISLGLTDEEAAAIADIPAPTLSQWRRIPEFAEALKKATALRLSARVDNRQGTAWLLERLYPTRFSKPEIQISLNNSFNQTVNALSITIAPQEIREIEAVAEPVRASVRQMFDRYRSTHGDGDQETNGSISKAVEEKFANYRPTLTTG